MLRLVPYKKNGFERTFDDLFHMMDNFWQNENAITHFNLDVSETEESYLIEAELPGVKKDHINLDVKDDLLTIHVKEENSEEKEEKNYIRKERRVSEMSRSLRFNDVNLDNIQAKLEDGILKIHLPKLKLVENKKRIEIE